MTETKDLVLDANIIIRAVLGDHAGKLIRFHQDTVTFFCPDICLKEASNHISEIAEKFNRNPAIALAKMGELAELVQIVERSDYEIYRVAASDRICSRDMEDWPSVATCLLLDAPLWTEDQDFFGCGIATWTTNNVGIYLRGE